MDSQVPLVEHTANGVPKISAAEGVILLYIPPSAVVKKGAARQAMIDHSRKREEETGRRMTRKWTPTPSGRGLKFQVETSRIKHDPLVKE